MNYYLNGQKLPEGQPFTIGGFVYPWDYLEVTSTEKLATLGISVLPPVAEFDSRFYWFSDVPKNLEDVISKDEEGNDRYEFTEENYLEDGVMKYRRIYSDKKIVQEGLKTTNIKLVKQTVNNLLSQTDWVWFRKAERDVNVPADIQAQRDAILAECDRLETEIAAATTVEELIAAVNSQRWDRLQQSA